MNNLDAFVSISRYAGERFDLVQAGGGNSSVKLDDGTMLIKASGYLLSDVEKNTGYSTVNTQYIASIVKNAQLLGLNDKREREALTASLVIKATCDGASRPSIETLLHSFLLKYTLHTHPIVVNMIVMQKNWRELLQNIFHDDEIALVEYQTPGIELALALHNKIKACKVIPNIIFLKNHGLIISSSNAEKIETYTEYVIEKIEKYLQLNMHKYKIVSKISKMINKIDHQNNIAYFTEDICINESLKTNKQLFFMPPFCPDILVYCGVNAVEILDLENTKSILEYKIQHFVLPKIIIYRNQLFIIAKNIKKAKEIEDVLKFHVITLNNMYSNVDFLETDEITYLANWEAEKYRQKL